ncbi:MAG TPA: ABC transporter substrate-binding protein, partial [Paracoccaceae bacterium]|nr:ABC transporter substrate-binding protein [Paracoccaceae bacterium]
IADPQSGQQGYVTSEPFAVEREGGFEPDVYLIADAGFTSYATTVEAMASTIEEMPEAVKCFVEGSAIGWTRYLYGDPSAANDLIQADNPDMSDEQIAFSIEAMKEYGIVDSGAALELGIGAMTPAKVKDFYDKMVAAGVAEPGLDFMSAFDFSFANTGAAMPVKWELTGE